MKYLKKTICFALIACCLISMTACGKEAAVIEKLEDLEGKTVAAQMGTTYIDMIKNDPILSKATLSVSASGTDALAMLYSGNADGVVMDMLSAQKAVHQQDNIHLLEASLSDENLAIAFPKDSPYRTEVNKAIENMKNNGTLDDMMFKWLSDDARITFDQFWAGTNGTLHCLISPDTAPLCYLDEEGSVVGFEVELMMRIARALNMKVEFEVEDFENLIPGLMNDSADCGIGAISATAKRAILVDFSETYLNGGTVVIVRDAEAKTSKVFSIKNSIYKTLIENDRWIDFAKGLGVTVIFVILAFSLSILAGAGGFLLDYTGHKWVGKIYQKIGWFLGYLPFSLWLMFLFFAVFAPLGWSAFIAGLVAFMVSFGIGIYNDIRGAVGAIDNGQVEAATSMGYSKLQALKKIYLPQAIPSIIGALKGELIVIIKSSSLLEFITVVEFQTVADSVRAQAQEPFLPLFVCAIVYWVFAYISTTLVGNIKLEGFTKRLTEEELVKKYVKD